MVSEPDRVVDGLGHWTDKLGRAIGYICGNIAARVQFLWSLDWKKIIVDLLAGAVAAILGVSRTEQDEYIIIVRLQQGE